MFNRRLLISIAFTLLLTACATSPDSHDKARKQSAAQANTRLGIEYMRTGDLEKSRNRLEKAIMLAPDYAPAHQAIAVLYEQAGDATLAEKHYRKSLSLEPDNGSARNNYGQFLCKAKRFDEAEDAFRRAADNPYYKSSWVPQTNAGICLMSVPDNQGAKKYLKQALKSQPRYAPALLNMGKISFDEGNSLSARAYLQRFHEESEPNADSLWLAIRTEHALGDHQAWGNHALRLKNDFPESEQNQLLQEWENERRSGN
ncbi:MAG: type IV pilus biogenesis/stability protein PilW [Halobacteria archaeon]|nr:type IV pilus biogenesis/stability protein PilW [Halobacteria archaeon]